MSKTIQPEESVILVASDSCADAEMIRKLLDVEFDRVRTSTDPDREAADFDKHGPDVLVLAFNALEKAERYYLGVYRLSKTTTSKPHRTVILCNKEEVRRVYQMCVKRYFDDYVLFWPPGYDSTRLAMAVHHALRQLQAGSANEPTAADLAARAKDLAPLQQVFVRQMERGDQQIDCTRRAVQQAGHDIDSALDGLSRRLSGTSSEDMLRDTGQIAREIEKLKDTTVRGQILRAMDSLQPLAQWAAGMREEYAPHLEAAQALAALASRVRRTVLIVDDDEFQLELLGQMLQDQDFRVLAASGGLEALRMVRDARPDLILLDVLMPGMDGIETTRRLKMLPDMQQVPILIMTGKSEKSVVLESIQAGASDFLVKPVDQKSLLSKIAEAFGVRASL